ncbi:MAG: B12-binding domain-containing radical SAM protein [Candidatus Omnitrophica bacterium]|nr:B12-binding domain-containing radical SAM protein [Candidatus Omnitrophota bacterium]
MKILFIYSLYNVRSIKKPLHTQEQVSFGISYISSYLKSLGHDVALLVLNRADGPFNAAADKAIKEHSPGLVCLSAITTEYPFIEKVAGYIKKRYPGIFVIAGGIHISLAPEEAIKGPFDAICVGEGEYAAAELAECLDAGRRPSGIKNLWIKAADGSVERNPARPFVGDLDSLPFPDRQIWQEWISEEPGTKYSILAGRGCSFGCTYCCNHALRKIAPGKYVRYRSPENIIKELEICRTALPGHDTVYFEMENIGPEDGWARGFISRLKEYNIASGRRLNFGANVRVTKGAVFDELFAEMKDAGFGYVNMGLESGSERIRRELLKRDYSDSDLIAAVRSAKVRGLQVCLNSMMGLPGETTRDLEKTAELNRSCQPDWHFVSIFYPYPGTELYAYCAEEGLLKKDASGELDDRRANILLTGMTGRDLQRSYLWFNFNVYRGYKPHHVILARVFRIWLWMKLHRSRAYRRLVGLAPFRWFKVLE